MFLFADSGKVIVTLGMFGLRKVFETTFLILGSSLQLLVACPTKSDKEHEGEGFGGLGRIRVA